VASFEWPVKNHVTRFYRIISWVYLSFPISYITVMAFLFEIPTRRCLSLVFSPFYILLSLLAIFTSFAMREVRYWAWYLFLGLNLLLVYENLMLMQYGESTNWGPAYLFSVFLLFLLSYRVSRELRVPWVMPKIRWWESDPRHKLQLPAQILYAKDDSKPVDCEILDLDVGGCFVRTRAPFEVDERVQVRLSAYGLDVSVAGFVVLKVDSAVTHPAGIGVKFAPPSKGMKKRLQAICERVIALHRLYQTGRYIMNPAEYFKALSQLQQMPIPDPVRNQRGFFISDKREKV
jgi:hypothetical protein